MYIAFYNCTLFLMSEGQPKSTPSLIHTYIYIYIYIYIEHNAGSFKVPRDNQLYFDVTVYLYELRSVNSSYNLIVKSICSWCYGSSDQSFMSYFSFQPMFHNWCNKGCCLCYSVIRMLHIKDTLLLIRKRLAHMAATGFLSCYLNGPLPYV